MKEKLEKFSWRGRSSILREFQSSSQISFFWFSLSLLMILVLAQLVIVEQGASVWERNLSAAGVRNFCFVKYSIVQYGVFC